MSARTALPPFRVIDAALRATTERLVREVVAPRYVPPHWNEFEWAVARAVCSMHGLSGLLATRLRWRGPPAWQRFLAQQLEQSRLRHAHVGRQLAQLDAEFRRAGIAFVALKGSALRGLDLYAPGERPQGDIDLWVDARTLAACDSPLAAAGYERVRSLRRHDVYAPARPSQPTHFGEHSDNPLKIEVHGRIAESLPVEKVDITATLEPRHPSPGSNEYPSRAALMRHLCLHAAGNMRAHALRFLQLLDIARLASRMDAADWRELAAPAAGQAPWWLYPPLVLTARYAPGSVPAALLDELRGHCPARLAEFHERAAVHEVSWSNLHIAALPGREWSRSLGETLRFARSRLWPDRKALDDLSFVLVAQPQLAATRWYGASHAERIVRWLFTRAPRAQTLSVITAALRGRAA